MEYNIQEKKFNDEMRNIHNSASYTNQLFQQLENYPLSNTVSDLSGQVVDDQENGDI